MDSEITETKVQIALTNDDIIKMELKIKTLEEEIAERRLNGLYSIVLNEDLYLALLVLK